MLSLIPTAANCRDSQANNGRVPQMKPTKAAMLRISAKTGNMAARLRPAKKSAIARDASHGQDIGITARGFA
jgi:hypothetical protein